MISSHCVGQMNKPFRSSEIHAVLESDMLSIYEYGAVNTKIINEIYSKYLMEKLWLIKRLKV